MGSIRHVALDEGGQEVLLRVLRDGLDDLPGGRLGGGQHGLQGRVERHVARGRVVGDEDRGVTGLLALLLGRAGLRRTPHEGLVRGGEVGQERTGEANTQVVDVGGLARLVVDGEQQEVFGNEHGPMLYPTS
jgi:hypothetical protein